ncbi:MAG: extracellular solute-binding protein [Desulfobacterales bacterium]|nr:extracellular solute-binding protein [Desulfobacterales bacterium]
MNRKSKICFLLLVCGVIMAIIPFPLHSGPLDPYIEGAKKEGSLTLGLTLREKIDGKPAGVLYIDAFNKRYPFLKVIFKRIGAARERERIMSEMTAGISEYDVATLSDTMINAVVEANLHRAFDWETLGVPKFLVYPGNVGVFQRTMVYGIAYNRKLVPDEVARTFTWETCTDPEWKGKSALYVRPRYLEQFYMEDVWGRDKTLDYAKRWIANKPSVESSRSTAASKLAAGAFHIFCGVARTNVKRLQEFGESKTIGVVYPEPVPVGNTDLIYVPSLTRHPNAAVLFMVWTGTKEAQNILDQIDFTGHPDFAGNEMSQVLKGKKIAYAPLKGSEKADVILAEILRAMGLPVVRSKKWNTS